jgi:magnesium-transporting ATPase (P-type)
MTLTGIKDYLEDYQNTKIDNKINNNKTKYLKGGNQKDIKWEDVKCGQIIYLTQDQKVPADMILLQSANMKSRSCYLETENLDGEKNLKKKDMIVIEEALDEETSQDYVNYFINSKICYNTEDPDYYNFTGRLELVDQTIQLSDRNLLLRGSVLANTPYIYGVVVYVGMKTKIMQQKSQKKIQKKSELELFTRRITKSSMIIQLILCIFASVYHCSYILVNKSRFEQYFDITFASVVLTFC